MLVVNFCEYEMANVAGLSTVCVVLEVYEIEIVVRGL